mmetsp:Transcript_32597/g.32315  ORF Transcript_32597/g.32315 Transcript_32597/m.32315 type:complete len:208 (+) Transcript_32597:83-706(+)
MLVASYKLGIHDKIEPIQIAIWNFLLQIFGLYAVFTRYKTRILFFVMLSMSYAIVLIIREGLDDLQYIRHPDTVENDHLAIRLLRISLALLVALSGMLGYIVRDSSLVADNAHLNQLNQGGIEKVEAIQKQIIYEDSDKNPKMYKAPICSNCKANNPQVKERRVTITENSEKCEFCGQDIKEEKSYQYIDEWFATPIASVHSNDVNP